MHLKTLTLRGFKSFASATTLRLEPGITCVVGPNGSGKSNVVDALAWVMGEQGARTLRGGKMEDVVFAGTTGPGGRPPLGRAEVSLTIDNSDGALPIGYAEVTVSRTMFRSGGSEYAINGTPARLLDVQELLSDSGIGREMHVIVGQGQLDAVLHATPEERRGFIEEAAGVLKHRKRKEKALRKLDSMQANLLRLDDLAAEVRRQLGPLARQADVARRAATVQAEVRDARGRLLADDLVQAEALLAADLADGAAQRARREQVDGELAAARRDLAEAERAAEAAAPRFAAAAAAYYELQPLRERLRGTTALAEERERTLRPLAAPPLRREGRDPEEVLAQAARVRAQEEALAEQVRGAGAALQEAGRARAVAEEALAAHERAVAVRQRAAADRRERLARLAGQVAARTSRAEAARAEAGRLEQSRAAALDRAGQAEARHASEVAASGEAAAREQEGSEHEEAARALAQAEADLALWRADERAAERDRAGATARVEALQLGLRERRDGAAALLAHGGRLPGVLGSVAELLEVDPGAEDVVAAALGEAADAVAVQGLEHAVDALRLLREDGAGRADLLVAGGPLDDARPVPVVAAGDASSAAAAVAGARPVASLVRAPQALVGAVGRLLAGSVVVPGLAQARALVAAHPHLVAVTEAGDVLRADGARGGSASGGPSLVHVQSAVDEAGAVLASAERRSGHARAELERAGAAAERARARRDAALEQLHAADARAAATARALGESSGALRAARAEADRLALALARARTALVTEQEHLDRAAADLAAAQAEGEPSGEEGGSGQGAEAEPERRTAVLAAAASAARAAEVEARLALRTGEERLRTSEGRAEALERAARAEAQARERALAEAARRREQLAVATAVGAGGRAALAVLERSLAQAAARREEAEAERALRTAQVATGRADVDRLSAVLAQLTDSVHREEVARAEQRLRLDGLRARAVEELSVDPDVLVEELGPHRDVPVLGGGGGGGGDDDEDDAPRTAPYVRAEQEQRLRRAERDLARLGRVNPLALEEYAALEERAAFLTSQLEDLRTTRADLLDIVRQVDERVEQVFAQAFTDTAAAFETVFARLFPGGEGRLVLTDPDDLLTTGVEVEARPAGKRVKRLSLLSGGERSLTAVGLLVAIFTARPSPFYVLDEVEAALDDANLRRLLAVLEELRASSQLIVITHQERTMEIADALYGVTMRGDGVSAVVSQRLRERAPA